MKIQHVLIIAFAVLSALFQVKDSVPVLAPIAPYISSALAILAVFVKSPVQIDKDNQEDE